MGNDNRTLAATDAQFQAKVDRARNYMIKVKRDALDDREQRDEDWTGQQANHK